MAYRKTSVVMYINLSFKLICSTTKIENGDDEILVPTFAVSTEDRVLGPRMFLDLPWTSEPLNL